MYELIIRVSGNVIYNEFYNSLEDLQEYIYNIESLNKNKKKMLYQIKSYLPNATVVVLFD